MPHDVHYILCVTEQSLLDALPILSRSSVLFLDCEGRELGKHGGALSLVALGTAHAEHIFLIDALALADARTPAMRRVFNLLAAPSVRTVVWDGRMDFLELRATYRVHLHGVLDLQLAEIESRTGPVRKEDDQARIDRLGHQIGWRDAKRFRNLHALTGLSRCLVECKLGDVVSKDVEVMKMHANEGSAMWMERPLPQQLLCYAANDVRAIALLYDHFTRSGWLPATKKAKRWLLDESHRYITMHGDQRRLRPTGASSFLQHPFLPAGMLDPGAITATRKCNGCERVASLSFFEGRGHKCIVCKAVMARRALQEHRAKKRAAAILAKAQAAQASLLSSDEYTELHDMLEMSNEVVA